MSIKVQRVHYQVLDSSEIKAEKVDSIKHSPIPSWLEGLTKNYLTYQNIAYTQLLNGIKFQFPGFSENIYTFNIKDSINDPIPEPLSLQHQIIQHILSEATPFSSSQHIPVIKFKNKKSSAGYWSIWYLNVKNQFESTHLFQPMFISDEGDSFPAFAQDIWSRFIQEEDCFDSIELNNSNDSSKIFHQISNKAEEFLQQKYSELEQRINDNTNKIRINKENAFDFQEKQMKKIGIENIKRSRMQRLNREKEVWFQNFESSKQVVPELNCLMICQIQND